ncbi:hypothetical protein TNIN_223141 [Trichonephila inaurata madagascariensis]|uniref:Uncharacterized protein n=1 Tax=Trichonephila inaurata madagascariensis TaxID=2747483 RepID=A0A8X6X2Q5_9ARAC|nr:hypothetical protein TNIN_223141 [Trichonephila inaurata madagascariensis]
MSIFLTPCRITTYRNRKNTILPHILPSKFLGEGDNIHEKLLCSEDHRTCFVLPNTPLQHPPVFELQYSRSSKVKQFPESPFCCKGVNLEPYNINSVS